MTKKPTNKINTMATTTKKTAGTAIPSFTVSKATRKSKVPMCKLRIPLTEIAKMGDAISEALSNAQEAGFTPTTAKAVINLF